MYSFTLLFIFFKDSSCFVYLDLCRMYFLSSEPLDEVEGERSKKPDQKRHQTVISLSPKEWKVCKVIFSIINTQTPSLSWYPA